MDEMWLIDPFASGFIGKDGEPLSIVEANEKLGDWNYRQIGDTTIGEVRISTVWLGIDHGWGRTKRPVIFETMIFGGELDEWMDRYETEDEAKLGHHEAVELVKSIQELFAEISKIEVPKDEPAEGDQ